MQTLISIHGELRWFVTLIAVIAIIKNSFGLIRKTPYSGMDRGLMAGFTGLLDLNLLLGLSIIIFGGGFNQPRIEHAITMFIAIIVAHSSAAWRKSDDAQKKYRNNLILVIVCLAIIFFGVLRLRGGWVF